MDKGGVLLSGSFNAAADGIAGKKALVIGGTSGIGSNVAAMLAERGAAVCVTGRTAPKNPQLEFVSVDFECSGLASLECGELGARLLECDILVVSYGPFVHKRLEELSAADWERVALMDYALPGLALSRALRGMCARSSGSILLFGGTRTEAIHPRSVTAAYHGAKTAVSLLVESVAKTYAESGIRCNAVLPGFVTNPPAGSEQYAVTARQVAAEAVRLIADESCNGVLCRVDNDWNFGD